MKIVHVMNWYIPGMGYQENFLPAEQKKLGHDVYIITSDRVPHYSGYEKNVGRLIGKRIIGTGTFNERGVTIYRLPTLFEVKNGGQVIVKGLFKILKDIEPDVVHAHGAFTPIAIQAVQYSNKLDYKVFIDDHSHKNNFNPDNIIKKAWINLVKIYYKYYSERVYLWLPVTYSAKNILISLLGISDEKIRLLHLGADSTKFRDDIKLRNQCRKKLNIDNKDILIISSGKFKYTKEIHTLVDAFKNLLAYHSDIKLLLLGNGPEDYMTKIYTMVETNNITDKVIFNDFVPNNELTVYYNAADIGVWPGDHTITAVEAVATGLPIVVPDDDIAYQVLFDNNAALGFERGNVDSLTACMLKLLNDIQLRKKISDNGLSVISRELSWEAIAKKSIEYYSYKSEGEA